jgi:hypothetical protein
MSIRKSAKMSIFGFQTGALQLFSIENKIKLYMKKIKVAERH